MENSSLALKIVTSVAVAVMVIALIIYVFTHLKLYQTEMDEAVSRENLKNFNRAFEVYEKNVMYGTDVLSCLNKAENNNQQYVYNMYYGKDSADYTIREEDLLVDVNIKLASMIKEKIEVNYKNMAGRVLQVPPNSEFEFKPFNPNNKKGFNPPDVTFYYFQSGVRTDDNLVGSNIKKSEEKYSVILWGGNGTEYLSENWKLKPGTYNTTMTEGEYKLVAENPATGRNPSNDTKNTQKLQALLSTINNANQIIYKDNYTYSNVIGNDVNARSEGWYSATWITAIHDFKSRKFKCTGIEYNKKTGYISKISFEELT